jgi:hypothetical protein
MAKMIDLVRSSGLPSHRMQQAARGALTVPAAEMIEILVYLGNHNKIFGQQAKMTLAGYDEVSAIEVAKNPATPKEVLEYLVAAQNLRPALLPALLENPSLRVDLIVELASTVTRDLAEVIAASARSKASTPIQNALRSNPNYQNAIVATETSNSPAEPMAVPEAEAASMGELGYEPVTPAVGEQPEVPAADGLVPATADEEAAVHAYLDHNAADIAAEGDKPFQAIGGLHQAETREAPAISAGTEVVHVASEASSAAAAPARAPLPHKRLVPQDSKRDNTVQKINKLDVKGRIQLAMKGNKEERSLLIRDGTKVVALAVLESGKITDSEVEKFASQKNVLEAVLRQIPLKRRFAKNYAVTRNLVCNPRTPLDVSLALIKHLLIQDLKNLSGNKEVSETVRKLALKMFKQKTEDSKKKG